MWLRHIKIVSNIDEAAITCWSSKARRSVSCFPDAASKSRDSISKPLE